MTGRVCHCVARMRFFSFAKAKPVYFLRGVWYTVSMKIIHTADNHLGAPLIGLSPEKARMRRDELTDTFLRLLAYADAEGVDAIFICGDLFDTPTPSPSLLKKVTDGIAACHARVFFVTGNHDDGVAFPYTPSNLHRFERGLKTYVLGDVTVTGADYAYWQNDGALGASLETTKHNFLLLHGEVGQSFSGEKGKIYLPSIADRGIEYLALGHIHNPPPARSLDGRGKYSYCGALEGHGFDECGQKGFLLIDTEANCRQTFVPFAARNYHDIAVDVSGAKTPSEMENRVQNFLCNIPSSDGVKVRLTGETSPAAHSLSAGLAAWLQERFFAAKVEDERVEAIDFSLYEQDKTLKGELVRLAKDLPQAERAQVLSVAFRALSGEELDV